MKFQNFAAFKPDSQFSISLLLLASFLLYISLHVFDIKIFIISHIIWLNAMVYILKGIIFLTSL